MSDRSLEPAIAMAQLTWFNLTLKLTNCKSNPTEIGQTEDLEARPIQAITELS